MGLWRRRFGLGRWRLQTAGIKSQSLDLVDLALGWQLFSVENKVEGACVPDTHHDLLGGVHCSLGGGGQSTRRVHLAVDGNGDPGILSRFDD